MDKWADTVFPKLARLVQTDMFYQEILKKYRDSQKRYKQVVSQLSEEECMDIEDYIALCEELQFQLTRLAYEYGVKESDKSKRT